MRTTIALALTLLAVPAFADHYHAFRSSIPRTGIRRVVVDIPAGQIDVKNSDGRTITLSGEVRKDADQMVVDDISAKISVDGEEATIERTFGPRASGWSARNFNTEFRVSIEVPRDVDVELQTHFGEVHIDGQFGDIEVDLRAGEIHLRTPHDAVRELNASVRVGEVHADLGDERVSNEGVFPGSTHYYNANGHSRINVHTTAGEVHVTLTR